VVASKYKYVANTLMFGNMDPIGISIAMCSLQIALQKSDDIKHQIWSDSWNGDR